MMELYFSSLPTDTKTLLEEYINKRPSFLFDFYLSGGTALSLYLGHRESEDLDFFSQNDFDPSLLQSKLQSFGQLKNVELSEGTLNAFQHGIKLQFLHYPYHLLEPLEKWNGLYLSSVKDIACTKLQTIGMRGSKKDFIDVFFLLQQFSLDELFRSMTKKYEGITYNNLHIFKSLVYFDDAEQQPMPRMHIPVEWDEVKDFFVREMKKIRF